MLNTDMTVGEAVLTSIVGFITVVAVIVILMVFVKLISLIVGSKRKVSKEVRAEPAAVESRPLVGNMAASTQIAVGSIGEIKLNNVSEREAAMVMAIVADEMKTPVNELRFLSVVRLDGE